MSNNYVVYVHINKTNGKRYYGITSQRPERRWRNGEGYNTQYFSRAINKYGWDGFDHIIIARGLTEEEAKWLEVEMIATHNTNDPKFGYNITSGGDGVSGLKGEKSHWYGKHHTKESVLKFSGINNGTSRSVICITTKRVFLTVRKGADTYNLPTTNISKCCKGKRKAAGRLPDGTKLVWRYVNYKHNRTYRIA
jgi:hypothetical protein